MLRILALAVMLIAASPGIGIAERENFEGLKALSEIYKLRFSDKKIRKAARSVAFSVDFCDPIAARRGIQNLKNLPRQIRSKIRSGAPVSEATKRDLAMLKIESAWEKLEQRLERHCGKRLVFDKSNSISSSYGFFVENTQKYAQKQLNAAVAAAKACDKDAYKRAIGKIETAADKSRRASRKNAQFRIQYAGDDATLRILALGLVAHTHTNYSSIAARKIQWSPRGDPPMSGSENGLRLQIILKQIIKIVGGLSSRGQAASIGFDPTYRGPR